MGDWITSLWPRLYLHKEGMDPLLADQLYYKLIQNNVNIVTMLPLGFDWGSIEECTYLIDTSFKRFDTVELKQTKGHWLLREVIMKTIQLIGILNISICALA